MEKKPLQQKRVTTGPTGRKRIIYEDGDGRECYFAPGSRTPKLLYVDEEPVNNVDELDPTKLIKELGGINNELVGINEEAKRCSKGMPGTKLETTKMRLVVLKNRTELLVRLLNKSLPDKRSMEHTGNVGITGNTMDSIPDEVLVAAIAGKLSDKQLEEMELLMGDALGGEH